MRHGMHGRTEWQRNTLHVIILLEVVFMVKKEVTLVQAVNLVLQIYQGYHRENADCLTKR